jgi:hypothetical protein
MTTEPRPDFREAIETLAAWRCQKYASPLDCRPVTGDAPLPCGPCTARLVLGSGLVTREPLDVDLRVIRQYLTLFGARGRDEQIALAALDRIRAALTPEEVG